MSCEATAAGTRTGGACGGYCHRTGMAADGDGEAETQAAAAPLDPTPLEQTFSGSHTTVTITTLNSQFSKLGFSTWKCAECDIWRVPGSPARRQARACRATRTFRAPSLLAI